MAGPNDRKEDQEREIDEGLERNVEGDAARIEAESTLSWRDREALLPDNLVEREDEGDDIVPRSNAGDVERGADSTDVGSDTPSGPVVRE